MSVFFFCCFSGSMFDKNNNFLLLPYSVYHTSQPGCDKFHFYEDVLPYTNDENCFVFMSIHFLSGTSGIKQ